MTAKEFNQMIENGEAKVLTLAAAKELKGKTIIWSFSPYESNHQEVSEMTVGEIISEWDYNKNQPMEGFANRTAYWESYMNKSQIAERQNALMLLDESGKNHYLKCFKNDRLFEEPTFTCSDADREVYFIEAKCKYAIIRESFKSNNRVVMISDSESDIYEKFESLITLFNKESEDKFASGCLILHKLPENVIIISEEDYNSMDNYELYKLQCDCYESEMRKDSQKIHMFIPIKDSNILRMQRMNKEDMLINM